MSKDLLLVVNAVANVLGPVASALAGGVVAIAIISAWMLIFPQLRMLRRLEAEPVEDEAATAPSS